MMTSTDQDKILGSFLGVAIGDALGMPVESWSADKIAEVYGKITDYLVPKDHKWYDGDPAGQVTDDTQLTLATAESIIENGLDMDTFAKHHVLALQDGTRGWGRTSRESVKALKEGHHWSKSSKIDEKSPGTGNGVIMKLMPIAAYEAYSIIPSTDDLIISFSEMTHSSRISALASLIQKEALVFCFKFGPLGFDKQTFIDVVYHAKQDIWLNKTAHLKDNDDNIFDLLDFSEDFSFQEIVEKFKGGCYVYESLSLSHAFFLSNEGWLKLETLFDVVNAGGDADSNASIVGGMLGALHGIQLFPQYLINGLLVKDKIKDTAKRFCKKLTNS